MPPIKVAPRPSPAAPTRARTQPTATATATATARSRNSNVDFRTADGFDAGLRTRFNTVPTPVKKAFDSTLDKLLPTREGDERSYADALKDMDGLLRGGEQTRQDDGADVTVTRDAAQVNDASDTNPLSIRHQAALVQVKANEALERRKLAAMSPEDAAQYRTVKNACLDAQDPVAALALQRLLFEGKLAGQTDLQGGNTVLDHLSGVADGSAPLADGVDRAKLLTDLVQELSVPQAIFQGYGRGTCAPTVVAMDLAMTNPSEYARIMLGLASPQGTVELAGGHVLTREPDTSFEDDGTGRALTQRLLGPAFMEIANGDTEYTDTSGEGGGAWSDTLNPLYEQVHGRSMAESRLNTGWAREYAMEIIDDELSEGNNVPVAITYGEGLHKVLVVGAEEVNGEQYVLLANPWGREERIPRDEFEGRLRDINFDPRDGIPAPPPLNIFGVKVPIPWPFGS